MISIMLDFLATYHQQGDANGMFSAAQALLNAIPDDLVALQFMGLALFWMGHKERALALFGKAATVLQRTPEPVPAHVCERAASITLQEAARPELAGAWQQIANMTALHGLHALAHCARDMAERARHARDGAQEARPLPPHRDIERNCAIAL